MLASLARTAVKIGIYRARVQSTRYMGVSSSGLGRRVLSAETGVRFPAPLLIPPQELVCGVALPV